MGVLSILALVAGAWSLVVPCASRVGRPGRPGPGSASKAHSPWYEGAPARRRPGRLGSTSKALSPWYYEGARRRPGGRLGRGSELKATPWYEGGAPARRPMVAGNWKLNPRTTGEAAELLRLVASNARHLGGTCDVVVFPPAPFLQLAVELLEGSGVAVGCQNVGLERAGAFTGEIAASQVRSLGCDWVLVGHSERRRLYDETDAIIREKVQLILEESGLGVLLCVGETAEEFEADLLETVVALQVKKALRGVDARDSDRFVVAYEPVWAIGTGKVATPDQAQAAHVFVRRALGDLFGADRARSMRVQYGGSVTPETIDELMRQPDVDGALVGGASLQADSFGRICEFTPPALLAGDTAVPRVASARLAVGCANALGESPVWASDGHGGGTLYWVSAVQGELWCWNLKDAPYKEVPRFGTTLGGGLVLGAEDALLIKDDRGATSASWRLLAAPPLEGANTRPNDGRVDRDGRLVFGMYNNYHRTGSSAGEENAGLYRATMEEEKEKEKEKEEEEEEEAAAAAAGSPDGGVRVVAYEELLDSRFRVTNCMSFSPDGRTMYFADTPTRKVYAFDYPARGRPSNKRLVWTMPPGWAGGPDGAQVDAQGFLWVALNGCGRVVRLDPREGRLDMVIHVPGCPTPTSCTFGGQDLDDLFITTAARPAGGGLYRLKLPRGIAGLPEPEWRLLKD